jgi:hypothetical protein
MRVPGAGFDGSHEWEVDDIRDMLDLMSDIEQLEMRSTVWKNLTEVTTGWARGC